MQVEWENCFNLLRKFLMKRRHDVAVYHHTETHKRYHSTSV